MSATADEGMRRELEALDAEFGRAQVEETRRRPVPDGRYRAEVERVELKRARTNSPMLEWVLLLIAGEYAGEKVYYHRTISAKTVRWIKQDLSVCGLDPEKLSDVAEHLPSLAGAQVEFSLKTKGEHRNVYINQRLDTQAPNENVIQAAEEEFAV